LKKFEKQFSCKVEYTEYDESEDMMNRIVFAPKGWDVLISDSTTMADLIKDNRLQKLNHNLMPNAKLVLPQYRTSEKNPNMAYSTPYLFGSTGLIYRKDLFSKKINSWEIIFKPSPKITGKIILIKDRREVLGAALKYLGYSANSEKKDEVRKAAKLVMDICIEARYFT